MTSSFMGRIPVPILLGITMFFWGAAFNATDIAFDYAPAGMITFLRALSATVVLLILIPVLGGKIPRSRRIWFFALLVGLGSTTLSLTGLGLGTQYAGPAVAAVLLNSAPSFAVLFARISPTERIKALRGIGLVIGFVGVVIIVLSNPTETGSGGDFIFGVAAVMIGAIGYAASSVIVRYMSVKEIETDLWGFTWAQFLCGTIGIIPFMLLSGDPWSTEWSAPGFWGGDRVSRHRRTADRLRLLLCRSRPLALRPRDGVVVPAAGRRGRHRNPARQYPRCRHPAWHGRGHGRRRDRQPPQGRGRG